MMTISTLWNMVGLELENFGSNILISAGSTGLGEVIGGYVAFLVISSKT